MALFVAHLSSPLNVGSSSLVADNRGQSHTAALNYSQSYEDDLYVHHFKVLQPGCFLFWSKALWSLSCFQVCSTVWEGVLEMHLSSATRQAREANHPAIGTRSRRSRIALLWVTGGKLLQAEQAQMGLTDILPPVLTVIWQYSIERMRPAHKVATGTEREIDIYFLFSWCFR